MAAVPIVPCSAIGQDRQGARYCHTRADTIFATYRQQCAKHGLVIRRVSGETRVAEYDDSYKDPDGRLVKTKTIGARYEGIWEIRDVETGQTEQFAGSGDGDNYVWSTNSAQTNARKQALLDYFEAAWPQPDITLLIIQESLARLDEKQLIEAMGVIMPEKTSKSAYTQIADFFLSETKKK